MLPIALTFDVTSVLLKSQVFWYITPCCWVNSSRISKDVLSSNSVSGCPRKASAGVSLLGGYLSSVLRYTGCHLQAKAYHELEGQDMSRNFFNDFGVNNTNL